MQKILIFIISIFISIFVHAGEGLRVSWHLRTDSSGRLAQATDQAIHGIMGVSRGVQTTDDGRWGPASTPESSSHALAVATIIVRCNNQGMPCTAKQAAQQYQKSCGLKS